MVTIREEFSPWRNSSIIAVLPLLDHVTQPPESFPTAFQSLNGQWGKRQVQAIYQHPPSDKKKKIIQVFILYCWSKTKHFPRKMWNILFIRYSARKAEWQGYLLKIAAMLADGIAIFNKPAQSALFHFLREMNRFVMK